jgi:hypothetical protein
LIREAFKTTNDLDSLVIKAVGEKKATRNEQVYGYNPKWMQFIHTWGDPGTVKVKADTTPNIADQGALCMFIGYADDNDGDVYRMWSPNMEHVHITHDIIWMKHMMFTKEVE